MSEPSPIKTDYKKPRSIGDPSNTYSFPNRFLDSWNATMEQATWNIGRKWNKFTFDQFFARSQTVDGPEIWLTNWYDTNDISGGFAGFRVNQQVLVGHVPQECWRIPTRWKAQPNSPQKNGKPQNLNLRFDTPSILRLLILRYTHAAF